MSVKKERDVELQAEQVIRAILHKVGGFRLATTFPTRRDMGYDLVVKATSPQAQIKIAVEAKSRMTPQTALAVCKKLQHIPAGLLPAIYAPDISPRVAESAREHAVGYFDQAGNCSLRSQTHGLLIERTGLRSTTTSPTRVADPFAAKSSRIVRAMLEQPMRGWRVSELVDDWQIDVSVGLIAKVKQALLEEGYAVELNKRLFLRDPIALLDNWAKSYSGPATTASLYLRGTPEAIETSVAQWCRDNNVKFALAAYSASWRIAPEVRYGVATVYVEDAMWVNDRLERFRSDTSAMTAETGANFQLWRPFDPTVFVNSEPQATSELPRTSPLQTYLDLKQLAGRGDEAATAVYERHIHPSLTDAAKFVQDLNDGEH